ncbi:unnamed protein product [Anisakis simplex]|uniref:Uncharacterized protein n=1 Tax=Anisakis simplex TaxID=6269 RepID=A0A0M3K2K2_ANISI|nr:unnamed protein product [Anisakis simplex]
MNILGSALTINHSRRMSTPKQYFVPSPDVVTSIVLPTILFCIVMVIAMLIGINKCKQWELDKIVEMRRTRRVVQRITNRLREKNFHTIQRARSMRQRKRALSALDGDNNHNNNNHDNNNCNRNRRSGQAVNGLAPPFYSTNPPFKSGTSPPPSYEDALLDQYYLECIPPNLNSSNNINSNNNRLQRHYGSTEWKMHR